MAITSLVRLRFLRWASRINFNKFRRKKKDKNFFPLFLGLSDLVLIQIHRETMKEYRTELKKLAEKLMEIMEESIGLPKRTEERLLVKKEK